MLKKMIFGLMTVGVLAFSWSACSEKKMANDAADLTTVFEPTGNNPLEKSVSLLENLVGYLKDTHIESEEDVATLKEALEKYAAISDKLQKESEAFTDSLTEEESSKLLETLPGILTDIEQYAKEVEKEKKRLLKEAEEKGINLDELDFDVEDFE